jgi:trigger factor
LKITLSDSDTREVTLNLEVEGERLTPHLERAARRISQQSDVPGYRRGRAPYHVVERVFGQASIYDEALEDLGPELVQEALEEEELVPIAQPRLSVQQLDPLVLEVVVTLPPRVELGDYRSIHLTPEEVAVAEEDVIAALGEIQEQNGEWVSVDRPVQYGDQLVLDMAGHIGERTLFEVRETTFIPMEELTTPIPGFSEKLVGLTPEGEEVSFSLSYAEDHDAEELAGNEVMCQVSIYEVRERHLPELNDELAQMVGDFEGLEDLKERIDEDLQARMEAEAQERLTQDALRQAVEISQVEYPALMADAEVEGMVQEQRQRLQGQGFTLEGYLQMINRTEEEFRQELRTQAEERLARSLILGKLVEAEAIEVGEDELQEEIDNIVRFYGPQGDTLRQGFSTEEAQQELRSRILARKAIARLTELVMEEVEEPTAEAAEAETESEAEKTTGPSEEEAGGD